ncbi:glycosyltransferase family 4 protein [Enterococcus faecium]
MEKEEIQKILKKVIQYELTDNVIFLGYQNNVFQYYALADASIFISKREGLGLAGLEAMAAGLPLISTYVGGLKTILKMEKLVLFLRIVKT